MAIQCTELYFNSNTTGVIIKCKSFIMKVYIPGFIGKQIMSWCYNFIEANMQIYKTTMIWMKISIRYEF